MAARDRYKLNTWYDAPVKKGKGKFNNQQSNVNRRSDGEIKYFVSNLPERCSSADLAGVLNGYAEVVGTYIARKYDRLGKRFGFVTLKVDRNRLDLDERLKDVWIGSYKLFISQAKFVDDQPVRRKDEKVWQPVNVDHQEDVEPTLNVDKGKTVEQNVNVVSGSRSFRDTLIDKKVEVECPEIKVDGNIGAFAELFNRGLVVR